MEIRLNKLISDSGLFSRREADKVIELGRVTINGKRAEVGAKVKASDKVKVDGRLLPQREETVYLALNKPVGITCTTDETERDNIINFVNYPTRIFNIGRLDKPSEGLILLTNDGDIVNKILRASNHHEKEYEVRVNKPITPEFIERMSGGIPILGTMTRKCKVTKEGEYGFRIILTQGLNRQIRRMCEYLDYEVIKLKRVRIMNITLNKLPVGQWRELTKSEIDTLNSMLVDSESAPKSASIENKKINFTKSSKSATKPTDKAKPFTAKRNNDSGHSGRTSSGKSIGGRGKSKPSSHTGGRKNTTNKQANTRRK